MVHLRNTFLFICVILAIIPVAIVPACSTEPDPVYYIRVYEAMPRIPPWFIHDFFLDPPDPHPDSVQGPFSPGDRVNLLLVISKEIKETVTFTRYAFANKRTGREVEVGEPEELGPFEPGQIRVISFNNPWLVPEQPDIYELRIYLDDDVVASAVFEVK